MPTEVLETKKYDTTDNLQVRKKNDVNGYHIFKLALYVLDYLYVYDTRHKRTHILTYPYIEGKCAKFWRETHRSLEPILVHKQNSTALKTTGTAPKNDDTFHSNN